MDSFQGSAQPHYVDGSIEIGLPPWPCIDPKCFTSPIGRVHNCYRIQDILYVRYMNLRFAWKKQSLVSIKGKVWKAQQSNTSNIEPMLSSILVRVGKMSCQPYKNLYGLHSTVNFICK